ncbi:MAG: hypothetical protein U1E31_00235 [Rickettsiales bacterium]
MSLVFSLCLHALLFSLLFIKIDMSVKSNNISEEPIKVSIATIAEVNNIKKQIKKQKLKKEFDEDSQISKRKDATKKKVEKLDLPKAEIELETKPEPEIKPEVKPEPKLEPEPTAAPEQKPEPILEPKPEPEIKPETKPEPKSEPISTLEKKQEIKPEPEIKQKLKPEIKSKPKSDLNPKVKPNTKPDDKQKTKSKTKQVEYSKSKSKPAKKQKTSQPDVIDDLLKNFEEKSDGSNARSNKKSIKQGSDDIDIFSNEDFNADAQLSISEINFIKQKVSENWNLTSVNQNIKQFKALLHIKLDQNGELLELEILNKTCPSNLDCEALLQATKRAVEAASPFIELNKDRYDTWKEFNLDFAPDF